MQFWSNEIPVNLLIKVCESKIQYFRLFSADRTVCSMMANARIMPSVCEEEYSIVAKQYILQQKCLEKWIGSASKKLDFIIFNLLHWP